MWRDASLVTKKKKMLIRTRALVKKELFHTISKRGREGMMERERWYSMGANHWIQRQRRDGGQTEILLV